MTDAVHAAGGLHCDADPALRAVRVPPGLGPDWPRSRRSRRAKMSGEDIERTIEDFANCAALAREAGYDGVEIMGSEDT